MMLIILNKNSLNVYDSMVSCEKGPTRHAYACQIGPFWQDTIDMITNDKNVIDAVIAWMMMQCVVGREFDTETSNART